MQYLIGQMLMCLLAAGGLGLLIGWLLWGMLLRKSRERTAEFEQRVSKLSGFPAQLADLEGTHAAFVASKNEEDAKYKARIAELEATAAKLPEAEKGLAAHVAELAGFKKQIIDMANKHKGELDGKMAEVAARDAKLSDLESRFKVAQSAAEQVPGLTTRLKASEALVPKIAELETKLKAKDAEISEHLVVHKDKDSRLASLVSRIADLEPVARRVPQLEGQVAQISAAHAQKVAEVEKHIDAHREKDQHIELLMGQVGELKPLADQVPALSAGHVEKNARISELAPLAALVPELKAKVEEHETAHTEKDARLAHLAPLAAMVPGLKTRIEQHEAANQALESRVAELTPVAALVPELKAQVEQQAAAHAEKDSHIAQLSSLAALVPELKGQVERHEAAHAEKDARISELAPLAELVPEWRTQLEQHVATIAERDAHIEQLTPLVAQVHELKAQVDQHEVAHAEKDVRIGQLSPLAALVPELKANVEAKDAHIGELLNRVDELQPLAAAVPELHGRVETAEYEGNLTTRRLRMAESSVSAHQDEVAKLQDQILVLKAEMERLRQDHASAVSELEQVRAAEPMKVLAAAAGVGFYQAGADYGTTTVDPATDHVAEFEKRIDEMRKHEEAKDAQLAKMKETLAAIEAASDPDTRRQMLMKAKDAELIHLRGVFNALFQPLDQDDVAARAYSFAKERNFRGGSPVEDWLRAERDSHFGRLSSAWDSTRGGTMF